MMDKTLNDLGQDAAAVAAVRNGDAERYRELVKRHERRVFAVAWSRLGDAALAEEATQEAFIRGYRRLWLLGDGAKFSGWITSVARNAAINLGLRHRRELDKRERWALEQPVTADHHNSTAESDPLHTPETLRQTLAELPAAHRECLVLFYIEGKSGAEAATSLGISESALRVRLHRARAAMRERLEEKLEGSLAKLRPSKTLVPAIMAGVFASASAKAATAGGVGATVVGTLTKFAPFQWVFALFPLLIGFFSILPTWLWMRVESANYRDQNGFRVRMFRAANLQQMFFMLLVIALVFLFQWGGKSMGDNFLLVVSLAGVLALPLAWRQTVINRSRFFIATTISSGFFCLVMLFIALQLLPFTAFHISLGLNGIVILLVYGERPIRMDYNLFLRAAERMLELSKDDSRRADGTKLYSKQQLLEFGRFLGSRWMADSYRWTAEGLLLRMPAFNFSMWNARSFFGFWSRRSNLLLAWDGKASAQLSENDFGSLAELSPEAALSPNKLRDQINTAVETAWASFLTGDLRKAEKVMGQVEESRVFVNSPSLAGMGKWRKAFFVYALVSCLLVAGLGWFKEPWMEGLKPVSITETQVRNVFANYVRDRHQENSLRSGLVYALSFNFVLPPTNLMTSESFQSIRADIFRYGGISIDATNHNSLDLLGSYMFALPMANGWLNQIGVGFDTNEIPRVMRRRTSPEWQFGILSLSMRRCSVEGETFSMAYLNTRSVANLRWLQEQGGLDYIERERLVSYIVSLQVRSGEASSKRPPPSNWRTVHGLFYSPGCSPLKDTYCSLAALEMLGGLDRIDREACAKRILKLHRGKGFFAAPPAEYESRLRIRGDAQDTFCAYESLRILGALDRVGDLEKWQFRLESNLTSKPDNSGNRIPTWSEIEAWLCKQRLEKIIRERKEDPNAPFRSLLEP